MSIRAFEFNIHFDGIFFYEPLRYVSGIELGLCTPKISSYEEFALYLEEVTKSIIVGLYYLLPGNDFETGLVKVSDDSDLDALFDLSYCYGKIEVYLNHIEDEHMNQFCAVKPKEIINTGEIDDNSVREVGQSSRSADRNRNVFLHGDVYDADMDEPVVENDIRKEGDVEDLGNDDDRMNIAVDDQPRSIVRNLFKDTWKGKEKVADEDTNINVKRLSQDKEKGKEKVVEENDADAAIQEDQVVADTDSDDSDYNGDGEHVSDSDSYSEAPSVDFLSEGEDELREVRLRRIEAKRSPKQKKLPKLGGHTRAERQAEEHDTIAEHDEFLRELLIKMKSHGDDDLEDPFKMIENMDKWPAHNPAIPWRLKRPIVGEKFPTHLAFKDCLTYYGLANGFNIWYEKSTQKSVIARCGQRPPLLKDPTIGKQRKQFMYPATVKGEEPKCPWRCFARKMNDENSFQVASLVDHHTCSRNFRFGSLINYKWIGKQFGNKIRANPNIKLVDIADLVMKKYKCIVSLNQCRAAKQYALNEYTKSIEDHYGMLRAYASELLASNPGSTVNLQVTRNPDKKVYFDRMYICLQGLKQGWKIGCRKVIALDGCFLKSPNTGELLTAIGRDGNNHIYPVAWALVSVENKDNWTWFLELLANDLEIEAGVGLTIMSDQHKGLIEAVKHVMPYAEHRQCARHIYEGFRKRFTGVHFRSLFWQASKASYPQLFERVMSEIRSCDSEAYQYLMNKNPKTWSRAFFKLHRACENVENGFSECFNSVILTVRNKPIITLFESIRVIILERQSVMRELCHRWRTDISPSIVQKLEWVKDQQRYWKPYHCGGNEWEVRQLNESFKVNEAYRHCSCRMWELSGVPCPHACAVIFKMAKSPEDYLPGWFRRTKYIETYSSYIMPVRGMSQWNLIDHEKPLPPHPRKMPGRPKKQRRRAAHEGGVVKSSQQKTRISRGGIIMTCKRCGQTGHNKRACTYEEVAQPPKQSKPVGRPRKDGQPPRQNPCRGSATVNLNGKPVAHASVNLPRQSRGHATVNVGGKGGFEASVSLNTGGEDSPLPSMQATPNEHFQTSPPENHPEPQTPQSTPLTTQESQTTPPRFTLRNNSFPKPRWTKCKILQDTSPRKGTSTGPPIRPLSADNVVIGSQSSIINASAALGVTSTGFQKVRTQGPHKFPKWWGAGLCVDPVTNESFIGGADGIPVPIWPKDVPVPSASVEWEKKQKAREALKRKVAEAARSESLEALKRKYPLHSTNESTQPKKKLFQTERTTGEIEAQNKRAILAVRRKLSEDDARKEADKIERTTPEIEAQKKKAIKAVRKKLAEDARKEAQSKGDVVERSKRQRESNSQPAPTRISEVNNITTSSQPVKAKLPQKLRLPSQRILSRKLAKQIEGPGSTYETALEL